MFPAPKVLLQRLFCCSIAVYSGSLCTGYANKKKIRYSGSKIYPSTLKSYVNSLVRDRKNAVVEFRRLRRRRCTLLKWNC